MPVATDSTWPLNAVDHFILAELQKRELAPQPPADRVTLIRRLYFDLLGLPPQPEEVAAFDADRAPDAYERLVDRLLASQHYGERWGQHWLDLARFAETDGFEHDKARGEAWKYRDWVIDALNADLPYDRFVALQLAGDELTGGDADARVATTFCLCGPDMPDINSADERRHNVLNELTTSVGSVLLALQVGCAQCHDHKYDPISQADFYRLRAVFEPAIQLKKNESLSTLQERPGVLPTSRLMIRGDWQRPGPEVAPAFPRIANPMGETLQILAHEQTSGRRAALAQWLIRPDHPLTARVMANRLWQFHFGEGLSRTPSDFGVMGDGPSHPELLDWLASELIAQSWSLKQLHRLMVTSATYRQAGRWTEPRDSAEASTTARELWERALSGDPENVWLSRFPRQRLSGEAIRDAMLASSETLCTERGGTGVMPPLPTEIVQTLLKDHWRVSPSEADHYRRSIYIFARRNLRYPVFEAFDRPDANASCPRRNRSTTAPQSLLLLNSDFSLDAARRLAGRVLKGNSGVTDATLREAFHRALSRRPLTSELETLVAFHAQQAKSLADEARPPEALALPLPHPAGVDVYSAAALSDVCLALFNASEFIYID